MGALDTPVAALFGVRYPIVQTGMGWVAGARLTAATSAAGGLGIIASATLDARQLATAIATVKDRTDQPFGVNLRADADDIGDRVALLIRQRVKVASFAMAPNERLIKQLKDAGVCVVPSVGARRHAEKVAAWGVDAVICQGGEGGGHTGSVPTTLLLPQVVDAVDIPVIAAGGFFDGRGLVAALAYGAGGVAMGTRFLLTEESTVPDSVKQYYLTKTVTDTVVSTKVDGVPHRVLRTKLVDQLESSTALTALPRALTNAVRFKKFSGTSWRAMMHEGRAMHTSGELGWSQVIMAANTPMLLKAALVEGRVDSGVMASGQAVGVIEDLPTVAALIQRIVGEANEVLERLGGRVVNDESAARVPAIEGWFTTDELEPHLLGTRGVDSGSYFFPPTLAVSANPDAPFEERSPVQLSRVGTLWSYTTNHYAPPAPAVQQAPYTICAVELEVEKMVILGPLADAVEPGVLKIGMTMELVLGPLFVQDGVEHTMYQWAPR